MLNTNLTMNGTLSLVANFATGSNNTQTLRSRAAAIIALQPDIVMGSLGFGNLFANFTAENAFLAVRDLIRDFTDAGILVIMELSTGTLDQVGNEVAWAQQVIVRLTELARLNEQFVMVDPTQWSINPTDGRVFSKYLRATAPGVFDNVHPNRLSERRRAQDLFKLLSPRIPVPDADPMAQSTLDRYNQGSPNRSTNLFDGGWQSTGRNAQPLNAKATGTVFNEMSDIQFFGSGTPTATCTLDARSDNRGWDQRIVFTGGAADQEYRFIITGTSANPLSSRVAAGAFYRLYMDASWGTLAANVIQQYEIIVTALVQYTLLGPVEGVLGAAISNETLFQEGAALPATSAADPPFTGMHVTEAMVMPSTGVAANGILAVRIEVRVKLAGPGTATLRFGRIAFREVASYAS